MQTRLTLPSLVLAALACTSAAAQSGNPATARIEAETGPVTVVSVQPPIANASDYRAKVADLDTNGDGVLTKKEVPADHALYFEFKLVDTDRNGRITDVELANWK